MSAGYGYVTELTTPTGVLRHLEAPWSTGYEPARSACSRRGAFHRLEYDFEAKAMETDPRPLCGVCWQAWRRWVDWTTETVNERLAELEAGAAGEGAAGEPAQ